MSEGDVIPRFSATERALHWGFGLLYLSLLATGLPLMFPALRGWIRGYAPVVGFRLHLACAALWIVVTLAVIALGDRRVLGRSWRELTTFGPADAAWLRSFPRWLVAGAAARADIDGRVGRFNAGQKLNALFVAATSGLLLLTGLALVPIDGALPAALVTGAGSVELWRRAHAWLTLLVLLPLAGHVFLALAFAPTRPSLRGMLSGAVDREWAARHYPRWCAAREPDRKDEAA
ncbi:MAG TPA: cytochrome b/b6 domain-containing protein [Methylomirabilota bacterium]|nr:cytochrome b/b6 domain-containing protein [Methylomirabilota bacterium]